MVGGISCWLSSGRDGWWGGPPADTAAEQEGGAPWAPSGTAACWRFDPGPSAIGPQAGRRDPAGREAAAVGPQGDEQDPVARSAAGPSVLRGAWRQESPGARRRATTGGLPGPDACYDRRLATNEGLTRPEACHDRRFDDIDGSDDGDADKVAEGMVGGNDGCTDVQADVCAWCCEPPFDGHGSAQCIQVPGQHRESVLQQVLRVSPWKGQVLVQAVPMLSTWQALEDMCETPTLAPRIRSTVVKSPELQWVAAPASAVLGEPPRGARGVFLAPGDMGRLRQAARFLRGFGGVEWPRAGRAFWPADFPTAVEGLCNCEASPCDWVGPVTSGEGLRAEEGPYAGSLAIIGGTVLSTVPEDLGHNIVKFSCEALPCDLVEPITSDEGLHADEGPRTGGVASIGGTVRSTIAEELVRNMMKSNGEDMPGNLVDCEALDRAVDRAQREEEAASQARAEAAAHAWDETRMQNRRVKGLEPLRHASSALNPKLRRRQLQAGRFLQAEDVWGAGRPRATAAAHTGTAVESHAGSDNVGQAAAQAAAEERLPAMAVTITSNEELHAAEGPHTGGVAIIGGAVLTTDPEDMDHIGVKSNREALPCDLLEPITSGEGRHAGEGPCTGGVVIIGGAAPSASAEVLEAFTSGEGPQAITEGIRQASAGTPGAHGSPGRGQRERESTAKQRMHRGLQRTQAATCRGRQHCQGRTAFWLQLGAWLCAFRLAGDVSGKRAVDHGSVAAELLPSTMDGRQLWQLDPYVLAEVMTEDAVFVDYDFQHVRGVEFDVVEVVTNSRRLCCGG